ncbi:MAG: zinc-binding alcohol dehydrogenase [Chloroflexi bacterium]|nr:zinc-binding alcohol dehydrogenase [Chloroflexota bacterium]
MTAVASRYAVVPDQNRLEIAAETFDLNDLPPTACAIAADATVVSPGTELAIYTATAPGVCTPGSWNAYPFRPGYGLVGRVERAGSSVHRVREGDRVFCFGKHASHQFYDDMASGKPVTAIYPVPDDISAQQLVMLRMALVAIHGPQLTQCRPGDTVAVFGLGVVGNLAAQLYRHAGLRVIGLDPVRMRCDRALQVGVEHVIDVPPEEQLAALRELTHGRGAEVTVEAVGHSAVAETCVAACADTGQVILLGSPRVPYSGDLNRTFRDIHMRWLTVRGALEWRLPPYAGLGIPVSVESNLAYLIQLLRDGRVDVNAVTTHVIAPEALPAAYDGLLNRKTDYLGVVVDWHAEHTNRG